MRSRNVSPGVDAISTTMRSERTRVPPVTADRSPPDSRMTGADSPVIADSSTAEIHSTTVASPRVTLSRLDNDPVSLAQVRRRNLLFPLAGHSTGDRLRPPAAQRLRLRLSPAFGHRLGEVGEEEREPEPDRYLKIEKNVPGGQDVPHEQPRDA